MAAGRFVGRVGGLAVALGVGMVAYGGGALASADTGSGSDPGATSTRSAGPAHAKVRRAAPVRPVGPGGAAAVKGVSRAKSSANTAAAAAPVSTSTTLRPATPKPAALKQAALSAGTGVTVDPKVEWGGLLGPDATAKAMPGILVGSVNATSARGLPLRYVGVGKPDAGGKIGGGPLLPLSNFYGSTGNFTYVPDTATLTTPGATERFKVMALELSKFDQSLITLLGPLGALLVPQVLAVAHRIPIVGTLASPLIGGATVAEFTVTPNALAAGRPTDFTYKMPSFDGTPISLNYFPAVNVATGEATNAPTVLAASGLACAANTDPTTRYGQLFPSQQFGSLTPGIAPLREDAFASTLIGGPQYTGTAGGYNVVTWDPRGEFASGGQLNIDNPMLEGRDVSSIISWLTGPTNPAAGQVKAVGGDPLLGMTGGSYGGGIQLTTIDPRIDAITPEIGWNSLISSLYPGDDSTSSFKTGWGAILVAALAFTGARVNPAIYQGIFTGAAFGFLSPASQAVLSSVGPTTLLTKEQAPTLQFQGIHDTLFPLSESVAAGRTISTNGISPDYRLFWFCGGHGTCDIPVKPTEQDAQGVIQNLQWLDQYAAGQGTPADVIPRFQWYDQKGLYSSSGKLPWDPAFNQSSYSAPTGKGGFLGLWPVLGGSGPYPIKDLPFSIVNAGPARNAINVAVNPPAGKQVVGSPTLSFTYSGLGTGHAVYAQLVDKATGLVLSNIVTPVQVTLNGREQTVTVPLADIVYTVGPDDSLTLQITSSAVNYENFWSYGWISISDVNVTLPLHDPGS